MLVRSWHTQVGACQCVLRSIVADVLGMKEACWFARSYPNSIEPVLLLSRSKKFRKFQDPPFLRPSSRIQLLKQPRSLESLSQANHPCKRFRTSSTGNHVKLFYLVESYKHAIASTWWPMLAIHSSVALIAADVKSELNSASALKWRLDRSSESCLIIFSRRYPRAYSSVENCWIFFILFFILSYPYTRPILRESSRIKQDYRNESNISRYSCSKVGWIVDIWIGLSRSVGRPWDPVYSPWPTRYSILTGCNLSAAKSNATGCVNRKRSRFFANCRPLVAFPCRRSISTKETRRGTRGW